MRQIQEMAQAEMAASSSDLGAESATLSEQAVWATAVAPNTADEGIDNAPIMERVNEPSPPKRPRQDNDSESLLNLLSKLGVHNVHTGTFSIVKDGETAVLKFALGKQ